MVWSGGVCRVHASLVQSLRLPTARGPGAGEPVLRAAQLLLRLGEHVEGVAQHRLQARIEEGEHRTLRARRWSSPRECSHAWAGVAHHPAAGGARRSVSGAGSGLPLPYRHGHARALHARRGPRRRGATARRSPIGALPANHGCRGSCAHKGVHQSVPAPGTRAPTRALVSAAALLLGHLGGLLHDDQVRQARHARGEGGSGSSP
mmetsp:Transcript_18854/g.50707  ORF Transcript_18854/g.50707 Transcript_18854/m.50707 type:complete len:205 (+) Transcript_18854:1366-1980(+)